MVEDDDPGELTKINELNQWRGTLRRLTKESGTTQQAADKVKIAPRTLQQWTGYLPEAPLPSMGVLRKVAQAFDYALPQQLIDLGVASPKDFAMPLQSMPMASAALVLGRLDAALSDALVWRSGVWDMAKAVLDSCNRTGHAGRWRARVFEIPTGSDYPHVGHRAVEFQRWRGQGANRISVDSPADRADTERIVREMEPNERRWISFESLQRRAEAGHPLWHLWERIELGIRLHNLRTQMSTNSYGGIGTVHTALFHNPTNRYRHIVVDAAGARTAPDPTMVRHPSDRFLAGRRKIIIIGPPSLSTLPIARLVGSALGWSVRSEREIAGIRDGVRYTYRSEETLREKAWATTLESLLAVMTEAPSIFVLSSIDTWAKQIKNLRQLFDSAGCVPIVLQPTKKTVTMWEQRQSDLAGTSAAPNNQANKVLAGIRTIGKAALEVAGDNPARYFHAKPNLPWWRTPPVSEFEPVEVGDFRVRAAYQLARLLHYGENQETKPGVSHFMPGSVLANHEPALRKDRASSRLVLSPVRRAGNTSQSSNAE